MARWVCVCWVSHGLFDWLVLLWARDCVHTRDSRDPHIDPGRRGPASLTGGQAAPARLAVVGPRGLAASADTAQIQI